MRVILQGEGRSWFESNTAGGGEEFVWEQYRRGRGGVCLRAIPQGEGRSWFESNTAGGGRSLFESNTVMFQSV